MSECEKECVYNSNNECWFACKNKFYNQALEDVYSIIISDIEDKEKVLKIQELVFAKKGISNCESEGI